MLIILAGFTLLVSPAKAERSQVRIGVLKIWGEKTARQMWQPTIDYLNWKLPRYHFQLVTLNLSDTFSATSQKSIDFILTNPGNYVSLEAKHDIARILTLRARRQGHITTHFGAVIFSRADRDDIQTLADLRNKSFMGVKETAFGGFQMAWYELKKHGINPHSDLKKLSFSGFPQDKVTHAVLANEVDAGTVRTGTLERMAKEGLIKIEDIRILNPHHADDFPFAHSTHHYPEWPLSKLSHVSESLAKHVALALLSIPEDSPVAKAARSAGWTVPLDYTPVHELMKNLQVGPYTPTIKDQKAPSAYYYFFLLLTLVVLIVLLIHTYRLRHRVHADEQKLEQIEIEWSQALDFLDEPIYMVDLNDRLIRANKAFYRKVHTNETDAVGKKVTLFTHPEGEEVPCKVCQARNDLNDTVITLEPDDPANKAGVPMEISIKVIRDSRNKPLGIIQGMRDLTKIRASEKAIRESETLFRGLLDTTPDPLIAINKHGLITIVNAEFERHFGYSREEIIGQKVEVLIPERYRKGHPQLREQFNAQSSAPTMDAVLDLVGLHKDGSEIPLDISLSPFEIGGETLTIAALHDISERIKYERELKRLAAFPEDNPMPIIECTVSGDVTYMNKAARINFPNVVALSDDNYVVSDIKLISQELKNNKNNLIRDIEYNGVTYEQNITIDEDSGLIRIYSWDITKLREMSKRMAYHASHDSLTGLPNRREFENQLERAIMTATLENKHHVVCYMDLDQFKVVNDTCGHVAGDELLKQLSSMLKAQTRDSDVLARLGGDEFGLLLISCNIDVAERITEKVRQAVEDFRFRWDGKTFKVGVSIGLVPINNTSGTLNDILSAADRACYLAKDHGRNRIYIHRDNDVVQNRHSDEMNWIHRIHDALDHDRFVLYTQEILSITDSRPSHHEILVRMREEDDKLIQPDSFLSAAERYNLVSEIDLWVIENAIEYFSQESLSKYYISINLSGQTLGNARRMTQIVDLITNGKVSPERICFEITETSMIANMNSAKQFITALRALGCSMALDDFGSGLSSFAYLKNLPVNYLKIDGSFVRNMDSDPVNAAMVESIIQVGHKMGLEIIAEYVENETILEQLKSMGANYVQGYGIAKPLPLDTLSNNESHVA